MLAALLIAVAGFVLQHRTPPGRTRIPPDFAWATVGVGALLLSLMYPLMLGGYPSVLSAFHEEPALFALINGIATFIFNAGNAVLFIGFAGAFVAETRPAGVVPRGIAFAGAALCLFSSVVAFGMLIGIVAMAAAAPLGLAAFGLNAFLGFAIWRESRDKSRKYNENH